MVAKRLAASSGMDYAIMSGGDVGPLQKVSIYTNVLQVTTGLYRIWYNLNLIVCLLTVLIYAVDDIQFSWLTGCCNRVT
jgi:hypothetical protein